MMLSLGGGLFFDGSRGWGVGRAFEASLYSGLGKRGEVLKVLEADLFLRAVNHLFYFNAIHRM